MKQPAARSVPKPRAAPHATARARRSRADLLERRLEAFVRALPKLHDGDVEGVHRTRVASRRLREALPIVAGGLPGTKRIRRILRRLRRALGPVREMDVSLALIDELARSGRFEGTSLDRLARDIAKDRGAAWASARRTVDEADPDALVRRLRAMMAALPKDDARTIRGPRPAASDWRGLLKLRASRRAGEVMAAVDEAGTFYRPDRIHRVRIAAKKLRYVRELAEEANGVRRPSARLRQLKTLQDTLGRLHDIQVFIDRTWRAQASMNAQQLRVWSELHVLQQALENECCDLHAAYLGQRGALLAVAAHLRAALPPAGTHHRSTGDESAAPG
jgi:CHAD domain-containing protein